MAGWTSTSLAEATGGRWVGPPADQVEIDRVTYVLSGEAGPAPGALMVMTDEADWSKHRRKRSGQGRYTVAEVVRIAAEAGSPAIMTSNPVEYPPVPILVVDDSRRALWRLAEVARSQYRGKIVGVTGTAGKSTTKAMLSHVLGRQARISASIGNWNTLDSVAMTVASTLSAPDYAVVEVAQSGMAPKNHVSAASFVRPHCAIITSIGLGEVKLFPTIDHTAQAKAGLVRELVPGGVAVLNRDTERIEYLLDEAHRHAERVLTFGRHPEADVRLLDWRLSGSDSLVDVDMFGTKLELKLSVPGRGIALNALATLAACHALEADWRQAADDLASMPQGKRVLEFHKLRVGSGTALLIDDSHNATELSMVAAFEVLQRAGAPGSRRIAALGHIVNLGDATEESQGRLAGPLVDCGVDLVLTTGIGMDLLRRRLPDRMRGLHSDTPEHLAAEVLKELRPGDVVLVKGSHRDTGFRDVARLIRRAARS